MSERSDTICVLHVDDEPGLSDLVTTFLERQDGRISVRSATSTAEGLEILGSDSVDCVVSDYDMPGRDGTDFLEAVRETDPELPFILYTGKGSEAVASEAVSAGVTDYMQKGAGTDQYAVLANRVTNSVEQYRAEAEAERTRRRLGELAESTTDCLWMFDRDWEELLFLSGYEEVWGRPASTVREDPRDFLQGVHPEDREPVRDAMERLSGGESLDIEFRVLRGDGEQRTVWASGEPVFEGDEVARVVGFTRDITDRGQARQLETLTDSLPGVAYRARNEPGRPMEVVRGDCEAVTGYTASELERGAVGWDSDVLHPDDREKRWEAVQEAVGAGRPFEVTYRVRTKGGEVQWLRERGRPVDSGPATGQLLEGFITDITERRERDRELRRYEAYLEESTDIITVLDEDAVIKYQSPAVTRLLGYEQGELVGEGGFDLVHPDDRATVSKHFEELVAEPGATATVECRFETASGDWAWLEVHGKNQLENDAIEGVVTNNRVITDRKDREQKLSRQNEQLEEFASVVSHDLRNPLNVAQARLGLLAEECASEHIDPAEDALDRMGRIIEDVLWLARRGEDIGATDAIGLQGAARSAWEMSGANADGAELVVDLTDTAVVEADSHRLGQLLENLFRNAVEHGGTGVTVTLGESGDGFYVADDGPGVPVEERGAVFDAGYTTNQTGTGFGLSIVKRVAEAHGWAVAVTEGTAGGARFEVTGVDSVWE